MNIDPRNHPLRALLAGAALASGVAFGAMGVAGASTSASPSAATPTTVAASPAPPSTSAANPGAGASSATASPGGGNPETMSHGPGETLLTGTTAAQVKAAALAAQPGATVIRVETDSGGAAYEAHLKKADGTDVTVKFDASFKVTDTQSGFGGGPSK